MIRKTLLGGIAAALLLAAPARSEDHPTYQSLWDAVAHKPDCTQKDDVDLIIVTCDGDMGLWYFTKEGHPAHPGVISRKPLTGPEGTSIHEEGWSFASDAAQPLFRAWMAQIQSLDDWIRQSLKSGGALPEGVAIGGNWKATAGETTVIVALTSRYFAIEDGGHYEDAYAFMDPAATAQTSFETYRGGGEHVVASVGHVKSRTIKAVDWEKDSPQGPPGTFAAVDYTAQTERGTLCGYVAWRQLPDGFFSLTREETNILPATLSAEDTAKIKAQFHCVP